MAWSIYIDSDTSKSLSSIDQLNQNLLRLIEVNQQSFGQLELQLALLNARFEEAFETTIQVNDV